MAVQTILGGKPLVETGTTRKTVKHTWNEYTLSRPAGEQWDAKLPQIGGEMERMTWTYNALKLNEQAKFDSGEFGEALTKMYDNIFSGADNGVSGQLREHDVTILDTFAFRVEFRDDTFEKKLATWRKKLREPKKVRDPAKLKAKQEAAKGQIRDWIQSRMKRKKRVVLGKGDYWDYFILYFNWVMARIIGKTEQNDMLQQPTEE